MGSGGRALLSVDRATIYRCDADFAQKRALLSLLCGENDREAMYLSESDVDRFVRTVLPQLVSRQENEAGRLTPLAHPPVRTRRTVPPRHRSLTGSCRQLGVKPEFRRTAV